MTFDTFERELTWELEHLCERMVFCPDWVYDCAYCPINRENMGELAERICNGEEV